MKTVQAFLYQLQHIAIGYKLIGLLIFLVLSCYKPSKNQTIISHSDSIELKEESMDTIVIEKTDSKKTIPKNLSLGDSIINFGKKYLGTPYVKAGTSEKGFDCSGYVYFVFDHFDIHVPRSSKNYENFGIEIPIDSVEKGDVLLFLSPTRNKIGHVGIVSKPNGKESEFMHATSGKKKQVVVTNLKNKRYTRRFVKAIRVIQ